MSYILFFGKNNGSIQKKVEILFFFVKIIVVFKQKRTITKVFSMCLELNYKQVFCFLIFMYSVLKLHSFFFFFSKYKYTLVKN